METEVTSQLPRLVSPEEYAAITCNRCGLCCEDLPLAVTPEEIAQQSADPATSPDRRAFYSGLEPVRRLADGWRYRCRHFRRDEDGLGLCGIYERRPEVCRGFPYGGVVLSWTRCAWYVMVREADATAALPLIPATSPGTVGGDEREHGSRGQPQSDICVYPAEGRSTA